MPMEMGNYSLPQTRHHRIAELLISMGGDVPQQLLRRPASAGIGGHRRTLPRRHPSSARGHRRTLSAGIGARASAGIGAP